MYILVIHGWHGRRFSPMQFLLQSPEPRPSGKVSFIYSMKALRSRGYVPSPRTTRAIRLTARALRSSAKCAQSYHKNKDNKMHKSNFNLQLQVLGVLPLLSGTTLLLLYGLLGANPTACECALFRRNHKSCGSMVF